jgi:hypothetical protein
MALAIVLGAIFVAAGASLALHRQTPPFVEVSNQPGGDIGQISAWAPTVWAFQSSGDVLANGNADANIFFYEHALRVLGAVKGVKQISCGPFGANHPSVAKRKNFVAFEADGGLCAFAQNNCTALANPVTGRQIFMYEPATGHIHQLTRCPGDCFNPDLSGNAKSLLFDSNTNLIGNGGIGMVTELYQADLRRIGSACPQVPCGSGPANPGLKRITIGGGHDGSQSFNGKLVAFISEADLLGNGSNPGIGHVFVLNTKRNELRQITSGNLEARNPSMSQSGRYVGYEQDQPLGGPGGPIISQVFVAKIQGQQAIATQVTAGGAPSYGADLDPKGRRISFVSEADLLGLGAPGPQVYTYNLKRSELLQITAGPSGSTNVESTTAALLGFRSADDFIGNGNSTPQFFVSNFFRQAPGDFPTVTPAGPTPPGPLPTVTPTPIAGEPFDIGLALVTNVAVDNGNNTLTTVVAATVGDFYGNPVPDGTLVKFGIEFPAAGAIINNGQVNVDPACDVSAYEAATGVDIVNREGVAHVCLTYPGAQAGTTRTITARAGGSDELECVGGSNQGTPCLIDFHCPGSVCELANPGAFEASPITLPFATNECDVNGQPCSDANPCTTGDTCGGGTPDKICFGGSNDGNPCTVEPECPDLRQCVGGTQEGFPCVNEFDCPGFGTCTLVSTGTCDFANPPTCQPGTAVTCSDDGNACTVDQCNFFTGACGMPTECPNDHDPCTNDVCNPADGTCGVFNTDPCDDGDLCTTTSTCSAGTCVPGPTTSCTDDGNDCTADVCNPDSGLCGIPVEPCGCSAP